MATQSKTTTKANMYGLLSKVKDPHLRQLLKQLLDQTGNINDQTPNIGKVSQPLEQHMDAGGFKIESLQTPTAKGDAVNKDYVDKQIQALMAKVQF